MPSTNSTTTSNSSSSISSISSKGSSSGIHLLLPLRRRRRRRRRLLLLQLLGLPRRAAAAAVVCLKVLWITRGRPFCLAWRPPPSRLSLLLFLLPKEEEGLLGLPGCNKLKKCSSSSSVVATAAAASRAASEQLQQQQQQQQDILPLDTAEILISFERGPTRPCVTAAVAAAAVAVLAALATTTTAPAEHQHQQHRLSLPGFLGIVCCSWRSRSRESEVLVFTDLFQSSVFRRREGREGEREGADGN